MKAAIYSRKSKFTGKGDSIGNQVQACKDYALHNFTDRNIDEFFIYEDEGFSGGNTNRPEFQRLLNDAREKKFDFLICYRLDRISRTVSDFSTTLELLNRNNIKFISVSERFDTSNPMGEAMIYIASVFAQLERRTIAERVRDNMLELAKTGRWLGGTPPLGYKAKHITYIDENMKERSLVKLTQVPNELTTVNIIFEKYLQLKSLAKLEAYLHESGLKTKQGYNFSLNSLRAILNNAVYVKANDDVLEYLEKKGISVYGEANGETGLLTYNKQKSTLNEDGKTVSVMRDTDEWISAVSSQKGIIEAEDWIKAQEILLKNKNTFPNLGKTHNALLTGILKCSKCGNPMHIRHGHISKRTGTTIYYYGCSLKKRSRGSLCTSKNAKVADVDAAVIKYLKEITLNKKQILNNLISQNNKLKEITSFSRETSLKEQIKSKETQVDNLINKLSLDDDISDLIVAKIKELKKELSSLRNELDSLNSIQTGIKEMEVNLSFIEMLLDKCSIIDTLDTEDKRQLIEGLLTKITWNGDTYSLDLDFIGSHVDELKKK